MFDCHVYLRIEFHSGIVPERKIQIKNLTSARKSQL